jgi:hypothetical protein
MILIILIILVSETKTTTPDWFDKIFEYLLPSTTNITSAWYWCDSQDYNNWNKILDPDNKTIESAYQAYLKNKQFGQPVYWYWCFGDGRTALIDFDAMQTYCCPGECSCWFAMNRNRNHMTHEFKRITK